LAGADEARRLRPALEGSLFAAGYDGPGEGVAPAVAALGAYGVLGDPTPQAVARAQAIVAQLPAPPAGPADVFLYAVDERCRSPGASAWAAALAGQPWAAQVRVGQTCADPPAGQAAHIVLTPAEALARAAIADGRAAGKRVWAYNGGLPRAG